ncbi:MAG: GspH/FimT family pseudopilin [Burkholderiales bacterium]|nr:GspH/FimT family pseudopilin [Burkholderiales bacterium]
MHAALQRGVTLIELMIALVIVAMLILVAMPSFSAWMANAQIRNAAEAILNGMQFARTQAIQFNTAVQFELTGETIWTVSRVSDGEELQRRVEEGSANATSITQPDAATILTFNGMGWIIANDDGSDSITQVDVDSSLDIDGERPLRITVTPGGSLKMCDPAVAAPDPRVCP